jgi:hypothetical protein
MEGKENKQEEESVCEGREGKMRLSRGRSGGWVRIK